MNNREVCSLRLISFAVGVVSDVFPKHIVIDAHMDSLWLSSEEKASMTLYRLNWSTGAGDAAQHKST